MDEIERSRIHLQHWIDHNVDHLKGYKKLVHVLRQKGMDAASDSIERGIKLVEETNAAFSEALAALPDSGSSEEGHGGHGHSHGHDHHHSHDHDHS